MKKSQIVTVGVTATLSLALFWWGAVAGAEEVMGIVAAKGSAEITVSDQPGAEGSVVIDEAVAPNDAFVVVHQSEDGMPGERLGYASIPKGTSRNIEVKLDGDMEMTPNLLAAVHIDRGKSGKLEFDMEKSEHSPDKPFFVDGAEVATEFAVR